MEACWAQDPAERPTFEVIARRIKAMQRWRKLIGRLQHAGETARRAHSMPVVRSAEHAATQSGYAAVSYDERYDAARRIESAPPQAQQQQQQHVPLAAALRQELMRPMPQPQWTPPLLSQLPPASSMQRGPWRQLEDEHRTCAMGETQQTDRGAVDMHSTQLPAGLQCPHTALDNMPAPVSSAVVGGTRLAVIPTCPTVDEQDALHSVADRTQIAQARVLVVASDLPSRYLSGK